MTMYNLYSDGNYFPRAKKSGFGGYIEQNPGESLVEYTEQIKLLKYSHSFELLGIIRGLKISKTMGIEHLQSHCDDKHTVSRLQEVLKLGHIKDISSKSKPELYQEILNLSKEFKSISFNYIPRNQNKHSDSLSRRYSLLMEKNFLRQFTDDLDKSEFILSDQNINGKKIFFSHPSLLRIQYKNNPFLVAQHRNKKIRRISKIEEKQNYDFLFIETLKNENGTIYNGFYYDNEKRIKTLIKTQFYNTDNLNDFCEFLANCNNTLKKTGIKNLWMYSNSKLINHYFEHKEKIPNNSIDSFKKIYSSMNGLNKVLYHSLPFEHQFSPEIALIENQKKKLGDSIDSIDSLMEQMQTGALDKNNKKYFGLLIRHHLRNYRNVLERDLNLIEKNEIIEKTTNDLINKGFLNVPDFKKMKV